MMRWSYSSKTFTALMMAVLLVGGCNRHDNHNTEPPDQEQTSHPSDGAPVTLAADGTRAIAYWVAPMDPGFTSPTPGKSPMGMDLIPVYKDEVGSASNVAGRATVTVAALRLQQLGVRTAPVEVTSAVRTIRAVGFVEPDAARISYIHSKISGWLERVPLQTVGDPVQRGQIMYELYSPELVATQEELLAAVRAGNVDAASAARQRLRYWDVAETDIAAIEQGGQVWRRVPFRSPISGYIHEVEAIEGAFVRDMTKLYVLMNLDQIWVRGEFYETDLAALKVGAKAMIRLPSGDEVAGKIVYIYPTVDRQTRFAAVRFSFANHDLRLRPGMYVDILYREDVGPALVVPGDAVIRTGARAIAFVDLGGGRFEPRELSIGANVDGGVIVYDGLDDGERVAVSANFFIDSESSLKAALAKFSGAGGGHQH